MQAFEAEVVTQKRFARNEFEATRFAAIARATLDAANLRRQFALVPQDLVIFSGSIAENIVEQVSIRTSHKAPVSMPGSQPCNSAAVTDRTAKPPQRWLHWNGRRFPERDLV